MELHHDISHIVVSMMQTGQIGKKQNSFSSPVEDGDDVLVATLEEILSIPCTVLRPDDYDVMKTSIEIMKAEEAKLDEKLKLASKKPKTQKIKTDPEETCDTNPSSKPLDSMTDAKTGPKNLDVKSEMVNGCVETEESDSKTIKTEPASSPVPFSTKVTSNNESEMDQHETNRKPIDKNKLLNGEATPEEKNKQKLQKRSLELDSKPDITSKLGVTESNVEENKPKNICKQEPTRNRTVKNEIRNSEIGRLKKEYDSHMSEVKKKISLEHSKNCTQTGFSIPIEKPDNPSLINRAQRFLEDRKVLLLEDEAFGRDGSVSDALSGPLLSCKAGLFRKEILSRLESISNIVRSLSFIPKNHVELCKHHELLKAISGMLLLRHKHKVKRKRKLDFENVQELKEKVGKFKTNESIDKLGDHLENQPDIAVENKTNDTQNDTFKLSESGCNSDNDSTSDQKHSSTLFAPKTEANTRIERSALIVFDENDENAKDAYSDLWWWDPVQRLRGDALVILSNIASTLDLSTLPDDRTPLCIVEACLHLVLCPSSDACDTYSAKPR